jgi:hypothetical protein
MQNPAFNERLDAMSSREKQFAMTRRIGDLRVSRTETWPTSGRWSYVIHSRVAVRSPDLTRRGGEEGDEDGGWGMEKESEELEIVEGIFLVAMGDV